MARSRHAAAECCRETSVGAGRVGARGYRGKTGAAMHKEASKQVSGVLCAATRRGTWTGQERKWADGSGLSLVVAMRSCRRDGCSVAQGQDRDRDSDGDSSRSRSGRQVLSHSRSSLRHCRTRRCADWRLEAPSRMLYFFKVSIGSRFLPFQLQHPTLAESQKVGFESRPWGKTLAPFHMPGQNRPTVPRPLWQTWRAEDDHVMADLTTQRPPGDESTDESTGPLGHCRLGGKQPRFCSGSTFPVGHQPSSLGEGGPLNTCPNPPV